MIDDGKSEPGTPRHFALSFNTPMRGLMTAMFAGPHRCDVSLDDACLRVTVGTGGWTFNTTLPRSSIVSAGHTSGPVTGWGAHGWRGRWLVNGSSRGLVRLT